MTTEVPYALPKKEPNVAWWLGSMFVLLPSFFLFQQFEPGPAIIVSPQTTYITEPLKADGLPDYERYVLKLYRDGIRSQDNAAVLLWQAMWPGELDPTDYEPFCRELGLPEVPSVEMALTPLYGRDNRQRILKWLQANGQVNATLDSVKSLLDKALTQAWKAREVLPFAAWLRENNPAIDKIVAATHRSQFYSPSPSLLNDVDEPLIDMLVPNVRMVEAAAQALAFRSMSYMGDGNIDKAWDDVIAIHRLARLLGQGHTLIERVGAVHNDRLACRAGLAVLTHEGISVNQAQRVWHDVLELAEFSGAADLLDRLERISYVDSMIHLKAGHAHWHKELGLGDEFLKVTRAPADWNIVLRRGNEFYDRMVGVARLQSGNARNAALSNINASLNKTEEHARSGIKSIIRLNQRETGEVFASLTIALFAPDVGNVLELHDAANSTLHLARLAAALTVYRVKNDAYPDKLDTLVPSVVDTLPLDLHGGKPLVYKPDGNGYLLYSVGKNGHDDGGSHQRYRVFRGQPLQLGDLKSQELEAQIPMDADDISIRLPRPLFKLPKLPTSP